MPTQGGGVNRVQRHIGTPAEQAQWRAGVRERERERNVERERDSEKYRDGHSSDLEWAVEWPERAPGRVHGAS